MFLDIQWVGFKVKIIERELIKSTRFLCLALIIKYTSRTIDVMGKHLIIKVNYEKQLT